MKMHLRPKFRVSLLSVFAVIPLIMLTAFLTHKRAFMQFVAALYVAPLQASDITGGFATLAPGAVLPSEQDCAARVHLASWEPRPDNAAENHRVPTPEEVAKLGSWGPTIGVDPKADVLRRRITGNFTGTTNEILQWAACKWGIDEDIVRAQAVVESNWRQSQLGDYTTVESLCPPGTWNGAGCYQSYGLLQVKYYYSQSAWPMSRDDTAFNVDYTYGVIRACYEGWTTYLGDRPPLPGHLPYHAGDIWGCLGRWYSGIWYDGGAIDYISKVKTALAGKDWLHASF